MLSEFLQSLGGRMPTQASRAAAETAANATAARLGLSAPPTRIAEPFHLRDLPHHFLQFMNDRQAEYNEEKRLNTLRQSRIMDIFTPPPAAQQPLAAPVAPPPQNVILPPARPPTLQGTLPWSVPAAVPLNRTNPR